MPVTRHWTDELDDWIHLVIGFELSDIENPAEYIVMVGDDLPWLKQLNRSIVLGESWDLPLNDNSPENHQTHAVVVLSAINLLANCRIGRDPLFDYIVHACRQWLRRRRS